MNPNAELCILALESIHDARDDKIDAAIQWVCEVERDAERYKHLREQRLSESMAMLGKPHD